MLILFFFILSASCVFSLVSRRHALIPLLLIGFIQDPFRKLVDGEPIFFIVTVATVFAVLMLKTISNVGLSRIWEPFLNWVGYVHKPLTLFVTLLLIQFLHSILRWGNVFVGLIGMVSYTAPLLAIIVGYYAVNNLTDIRNFMKVYISFGLLVAATVTLSFLGFELTAFQEVGVGLKIYDQGTVLRSFSGIMRTGEIAAWHLATTICFMSIIYMTSTQKPPLLLVAVVILFLVLAIAFTGRRKMLMLISLFGVFYAFGFFYYRRALSVTTLLMSSGVVLVLWGGFEFVFPSEYTPDLQNYLARSSSVYSGASSRFFELGLSPVHWAFERVGLLGGGLGIASQGAHFFQNTNVAGGSGEGGLGKVMVELGLPGLVIIFWLMMAFTRYIFRCISLSSQSFVQPQLMPLVLGFSVFLLVNIMTFSVASQVYGDIFVLLMLGLVSGFLFAVPKLVLLSLNSDRTRNMKINLPESTY